MRFEWTWDLIGFKAWLSVQHKSSRWDCMKNRWDISTCSQQILQDVFSIHCVVDIKPIIRRSVSHGLWDLVKSGSLVNLLIVLIIISLRNIVHCFLFLNLIIDLCVVLLVLIVCMFEHIDDIVCILIVLVCCSFKGRLVELRILFVIIWKSFFHLINILIQ